MERQADGTQALLVWGDYVCPFCYLGNAVVRLSADDLDVPVEHRAFELWPPAFPLPDLESGHYRAGFETSVRPWAERMGVEVRWNGMATRTRKAHEAAAFARTVERFDAMHDALYRAYWVEGRDIGRIDVLTEVGKDVGLDPVALRVELDVDAHTAAVAAEAAEALECGIRAVPAYRLGEHTLTGLHEPDALIDWAGAVAPRRPGQGHERRDHGWDVTSE